MDTLVPFLPNNTIDKLTPYFDDTFLLKIVNPRKTKLGDFRPARTGKQLSIITINNDLNPYAFLITLVHEIAHHHVWLSHKQRVAPHGKEWKSTFKYLLLPFLHPTILPDDVITALSKYLINPKASSCSDINLFRVLSAYDNRRDETLYLENLAENSLFSIDHKRIFRKGKKLRTRYKCLEIHSQKQYFVHGLAVVKIVDK